MSVRKLNSEAAKVLQHFFGTRPQWFLARLHRVDQTMVSSIGRGKTWNGRPHKKGRTFPCVRDRFEADTIPEPNTGCWLWMGALGSWGYGVIWGDGRLKRAHRVAFELYVGPIPEGMDVCHKCDVTWCVNPEHLFLGDDSDNQRDRALKGRARISKKGLPHGVSEERGSYRASASLRGKKYHFGSFTTPEEASAAAITGRHELWNTEGVR